MANKLTGVSRDDYAIEVEVEGFKYIIDSPEDLEGYEPQGALPGGYLMAALAGCKVMVARYYLIGRGMEDVKVHVEMSVEAEKDDNKKFFQHFKTELVFEGDISEKDIQKIEKMLDAECAIEQILRSDQNTFETTYRIKE